METKTETLKQSQLIGRLVLDRSTTEEVGKVEQLWLDPKTHQVLGLVCKSGGLLGGKKQIFKWTQVTAIGDSIMLDMSSGQVEEMKPDQLDRIVGHELWTDRGNKAGKLVDYLFDPKTGKVIDYIFTSSGLTGIVDGTYLLSPQIIDKVGSKRVIVSETAVGDSQQYEEGVGKKISKAGEFLQEDAKKTHQDLLAVQDGLQGALGQLKSKAGTMAEQAKETAKETAGQLKSKAETVAERAKETAKETAGQLKSKAETVAELAKETAKETASQLKSKADRVVEKAKSPESDDCAARTLRDRQTPVPRVIEVDAEATEDESTMHD